VFMGLHLSEEVPLTSPQKKILPLVRCKLISNQIETLDFTLKKQSIEPAREPKTAINARKRQSNMTRSIIASTRCAPCSRGVAGNSDWSADGASNKCSRDATSSSRGRGNTLSYCDAKTLKLGTMCFFPCKLFLVHRDGCNFLASQNVLSAYFPEQEVLLVNALPPQDLGETVFRQWLEETIAVRHGLKN
jgi:hypothetical protein